MRIHISLQKEIEKNIYGHGWMYKKAEVQDIDATGVYFCEKILTLRLRILR